MQPQFCHTFFKKIVNKGAGMTTDNGLDSRSSIPGRSKTFSALRRPDKNLGLTSPLIQWVPRGSFPGVRRPGLEADHSSPNIAEVNNGGAMLPLPHTSYFFLIFTVNRSCIFFRISCILYFVLFVVGSKKYEPSVVRWDSSVGTTTRLRPGA
jgi:hypothetical protein